MPRINLATSAVTEPTPTAAPSTVRGGALISLLLAALALIAVFTAADYYYTEGLVRKAKEHLEQAKKQKAELEKVKKERDEYEKRKKLLETRLEIIRKLDAERRGPVGVMSQVNARMPDGVRLERLSLRGNSVTIEGVVDRPERPGEKKNRDIVTEFAQQLELRSNGLFTNVNPTFQETGQALPDATEQQSLKFTIVCDYNPPQPVAPPSTTQAAQVGK
jgi:type IV pilus assembly protein PilN